MRLFIIGLITGIVCSFSAISVLQNSQSSQLPIEQSKSALLVLDERFANDRPSIPFEGKPQRQTAKLINVHDETIESETDRNENSASGNLENKDSNDDLIGADITRRDKLKGVIGQLNNQELSVIEHAIRNLSNLPAAIQFANEPIDSDWALSKQAELEYSFYNISPLRNIGQLKNIVCRSQFCEVSLQIPAGTLLESSDYRRWSNPVSVTYHASEVNDYELVLYIARDRK